ncbi:MAG TPA: cell division protein FtsL [Nitrospirota bacterium]|nr:cell division protein FtsL [Nitrospirota bacterium]
MSTRISNIGFITFGWQKRSGLVKALITGAALVVVLLYVGEKVRIYQMGYQIEDLKKEKKELERANRALKIEASSLSASARIEDIAIRRLGMVRPSKERIVVVKRRAAGTRNETDAELIE